MMTHADLTKEMKERIKVDLELRYLDSEFDHLLELSLHFWILDSS